MAYITVKKEYIEYLQSLKKLEREKEEQQKFDKNLEQNPTERQTNEKVETP